MIQLRQTAMIRRAAPLLLSCLVAAALCGCFGKTSVSPGSAPPPTNTAATVYATPAPASGTPVSSGHTTPAGTKAYTVMGKTYKPMLNAEGYSEEGLASWYGADFHGKKTANGETYDMYAMTAAHKLLPFGTQVKVINLATNKSIVVRINDRGPFVGSRIIDLSRKGAEELDMVGPGTARVRIETIGAISGRQGNDLMGAFYVQIGAFSVRDNAHSLAKRIQKTGKASRVVNVPTIGFHRVQAGPYNSLSAAEAASVSLLGEYPNNFVVAE